MLTSSAWASPVSAISITLSRCKRFTVRRSISSAADSLTWVVSWIAVTRRVGWRGGEPVEGEVGDVLPALAGGEHVRVVEHLDLGRAGGGLEVLGVGVLDLRRHQVALAAGDEQQRGALRCGSRPRCRRGWPFPPTSTPTSRFQPWTPPLGSSRESRSQSRRRGWSRTGYLLGTMTSSWSRPEIRLCRPRDPRHRPTRIGEGACLGCSRHAGARRACGGVFESTRTSSTSPMVRSCVMVSRSGR
jgi:hypothetical protein